MRILSVGLLLVGLLLVTDAAAFKARYTLSAFTTLDHGANEFRRSVDDWLSSRRE